MRQLWKKLTFWVDRKPSKVNFSTRLIAYALDWAIGGMIATPTCKMLPNRKAPTKYLFLNIPTLNIDSSLFTLKL